VKDQIEDHVIGFLPGMLAFDQMTLTAGSMLANYLCTFGIYDYLFNILYENFCIKITCRMINYFLRPENNLTNIEYETRMYKKFNFIS